MTKRKTRFTADATSTLQTSKTRETGRRFAEAKLQPFFGELNKFNPYFDKDIYWARKGGSCFLQGEDFTFEQLYEICFKCCETGIKYYLEKFAI